MIKIFFLTLFFLLIPTQTSAFSIFQFTEKNNQSVVTNFTGAQEYFNSRECSLNRFTNPYLWSFEKTLDEMLGLCTKEKVVYVSTEGNDLSNGSLCSDQQTYNCGPVATIQHAIDISEDNGTVRIFPGTYYQNFVINKPLAVESYDHKNKAVVDASYSYQPFSDSAYHYAARITHENTSLKNIHFKNYANQDGNVCPLNCKQNVGIEVAGSFGGNIVKNVLIEKNLLTDIIYPKLGSAKGALPIFVYGFEDTDEEAVSNITIRDNELTQNAPSGSWQGNAILLISNVKNSIVENNYIHNFISSGWSNGHYLALEPGGNVTMHSTLDGPEGMPVELDHPRNIIFRNNKVERGGGAIPTCFYNMGAQNILVESNIFNGCHYGVNIATEEVPQGLNEEGVNNNLSSDTKIINNIILNSFQGDIQVGNPAGVVNPSYKSVKNTTIIGNLLVSTSTDATVRYRILLRPGNIGTNIFAHNTIVSNAFLLFRDNTTTTNSFISDNNCWENTSSTVAYPYTYNFLYKNFATYQSSSGQDINSQFGSCLE